MDATAGLQMSQPRPRPCFVQHRLEVLSSPMRTRWNSCWREYGKCSHRWLSRRRPCVSSAFRICVTSGVQPPQEVPAVVFFRAPRPYVQPASMAAQMSPFATLLQEQICALSAVRPSARRRACRSGTRAGRNSCFRVFGQRHGVLRPSAGANRSHRGVADQHRRQEDAGRRLDDELLVDLAALVDEGIHSRAGCRAMRVADGSDLDAHELELGAHVGAEAVARRVQRCATAMRAIW